MYKQVIVIRSDLKMGKGKTAAQAAHASLQAFQKADKKIIGLWNKEGGKKVILEAKGLKELLALKEKCEAIKIPHALISDAGLTEIRRGTITALGIGPHKEGVIDKATGSLPLLK